MHLRFDSIRQFKPTCQFVGRVQSQKLGDLARSCAITLRKLRRCQSSVRQRPKESRLHDGTPLLDLLTRVLLHDQWSGRLATRREEHAHPPKRILIGILRESPDAFERCFRGCFRTEKQLERRESPVSFQDSLAVLSESDQRLHWRVTVLSNVLR